MRLSQATGIAPPKIKGVLFIKITKSAWRPLQIRNENADIIRIFSSKEYNDLKG